MTQWIYYTDIIAGNFHRAVEYLNERHSEWDVVTMTIAGNYTIVVYRLPKISAASQQSAASQSAASQSAASQSAACQSAADQSADYQLYLLIH